MPVFHPKILHAKMQETDKPVDLTSFLHGEDGIQTTLEGQIEPIPPRPAAPKLKVIEPTSPPLSPLGSTVPVTPTASPPIPNILLLAAMDEAITGCKEPFKSLKLILVKEKYSADPNPETLKNFINIASTARENKVFGIFDVTASYAHTASAKAFYQSLKGDSETAYAARNEICAAFQKDPDSLPKPTARNQDEFATIVTTAPLPSASPTASGKKD
jgi:hypothetical protein